MQPSRWRATIELRWSAAQYNADPLGGHKVRGTGRSGDLGGPRGVTVVDLAGNLESESEPDPQRHAPSPPDQGDRASSLLVCHQSALLRLPNRRSNPTSLASAPLPKFSLGGKKKEKRKKRPSCNAMQQDACPLQRLRRQHAQPALASRPHTVPAGPWPRLQRLRSTRSSVAKRSTSVVGTPGK